MIFQEKSFSYYILLTDQISFLIAFGFWDIGQYVYYNSCEPGCDLINFEISLIALIKSFFYMTKINILSTRIGFEEK